MAERDPTSGDLGRSHGFVVVGTDGPLGVVETPLFPPNADEPDYLVVRRQRRIRTRHPVVHVSLVREVGRGVVSLRASSEQVDRLPESLPLAI
jgi:hypothetical protein